MAKLQAGLAAVMSAYLSLNDVDLLPAHSEELPFFDVMLREWAAKRLQPGDHLLTQIRESGLYHHVIYMGDGTIVDNSTTDGGHIIRRRPWEEFVGEYHAHGKKIYKILYKDNAACDRRGRAMALAEALSDPRLAMEYRSLGVKCDAFATFCWTGDWCAPCLQALSCTPSRAYQQRRVPYALEDIFRSVSR
jgi:hypothetical protein